ncbi:TIGR03862 family flavoprotein [Saccharibacter floricola]|uniref:TIGR03862 family flavoprotein n=1 Tax=Saccharibacter floricola TaxID=231053 RepID=UPI0003788FCF|nr:TIGR03862 family flavoprotein [Saccharibacter floricola]
MIDKKAASHLSSVIVIGGGPAGLFAAERLAHYGHKVTLFDHMARPGRKLLMAGRSGLNLTHSESFDHFLSRYGKAHSWLEPALRQFPPSALQHWAEDLGQPCFIGSSGRIFLKSLKASPLLRAWLSRLEQHGVNFQPHHRLTAITAHEATFDTPHGPRHVPYKACVLALGGASWSRLGSDGQWASLFPTLCAPFGPSNCGFVPRWPQSLSDRHEGDTLRGIRLQYGTHHYRGDLILTLRGLEGAPLYTLSPLLRDALQTHHTVSLSLNLRPTLSAEAIHKRLASQRPRESRSNRLRKALGLDRFARALLSECAPHAQTPDELTRAVTQLPLTLTAPMPLDRAISTSGGLKHSALTDDFMLRHQPGVFACGEMLDWEAPTGGYLLQGCFSTAYTCTEGVHRWLFSSGNGITAP